MTLKTNFDIKKTICIKRCFNHWRETCKRSSHLVFFTTLCSNGSNFYVRRNVKTTVFKTIEDSWIKASISSQKKWIYISWFSASASKRQLCLPYLRVDSAKLWTKWVSSSFKNPQTSSPILVTMISIWSKKKHRTKTLRKWLEVRIRSISASIHSTWSHIYIE